MKIKLIIVVALILGSIGTTCTAQQFTYKPLNPAFGGESFNYNWLLSSATAQNKITAPANAASQQTELERFGETLNRQILSQISRRLLEQQIAGIGNFDQEGTFTFGNLAVEIVQTAEGLVINILDTTNGEQTQVIVP